MPSQPPGGAIAIFSKRNGLAAATLAAFVFGCLDGNRALMQLGLVFGAILGAAYWFSRGLLAGFELRRTHYPRCLEDETLRVELTLTNAGRNPALMLNVEERFEPAIRSRIRSLIAAPVSGTEEAGLVYARRCEKRRGLYMLGPALLEAADPLGIFPQTRLMDALTTLRVAPKAARLERFDPLGRGTHFGVGARTVARPGPGEEFLQLREYRPGDSPRLIHWGASARRREWQVKEFDINVATEMAIFADMSRLAHTGIGDVTSGELAIKCIVAMAATALAEQHRTAVFLSAETVEEIPFGGGPEHLNYILDRLTLVRTSGDSRFETAIAERLASIRRGSTAAFVVTATRVDPDALENILQHLGLVGIKTQVALIDNTTFPKIYLEQEIQQNTAAPMDALARRFHLAGAQVFLLAKDVDLRQALGTGGA